LRLDGVVARFEGYERANARNELGRNDRLGEKVVGARLREDDDAGAVRRYRADGRNKWKKVLKDVGAQPVLQ